MANKKYKTLQELFANKKRWTQGTTARKKGGFPTDADNPEAISWCMLGGVQMIYGGGESSNRIYRRLVESLGEPISGYNDRTGTTITDIRREIEKAGV